MNAEEINWAVRNARATAAACNEHAHAVRRLEFIYGTEVVNGQRQLGPRASDTEQSGYLVAARGCAEELHCLEAQLRELPGWEADCPEGGQVQVVRAAGGAGGARECGEPHRYVVEGTAALAWYEGDVMDAAVNAVIASRRDPHALVTAWHDADGMFTGCRPGALAAEDAALRAVIEWEG